MQASPKTKGGNRKTGGKSPRLIRAAAAGPTETDEHYHLHANEYYAPESAGTPIGMRMPGSTPAGPRPPTPEYHRRASPATSGGGPAGAIRAAALGITSPVAAGGGGAGGDRSEEVARWRARALRVEMALHEFERLVAVAIGETVILLTLSLHRYCNTCYR